MGLESAILHTVALPKPCVTQDGKSSAENWLLHILLKINSTDCCFSCQMSLKAVQDAFWMCDNDHILWTIMQDTYWHKIMKYLYMIRLINNTCVTNINIQWAVNAIQRMDFNSRDLILYNVLVWIWMNLNEFNHRM